MDIYKVMIIYISTFRYNGHLPSGDKGRRKSKFILYKKQCGNGVKPFRKHIVKNPHSAKVSSENFLLSK
jgi:pellino protein